MHRLASFLLLCASLATLSSCALTEWGNHSVRMAWADYNTLRAPALYVEQVDHLPYTAPKVGYYRWMYDKDPGHQMACLGPVRPPVCRNCDPQAVPPGDEPFAYEVSFPGAVPRPSDQLWGTKLPEPINVAGTPAATNSSLLPSPTGPPPSRPLPNGPVPNGLVPIVPPVPKPADEPGVKDSGVKDHSAGTPQNGPQFLQPIDEPKLPLKQSLPRPALDGPSPPKPADENVPPILGPSSEEDPRVRLTTGRPASAPGSPASSNTAPAVPN